MRESKSEKRCTRSAISSRTSTTAIAPVTTRTRRALEYLPVTPGKDECHRARFESIRPLSKRPGSSARVRGSMSRISKRRKALCEHASQGSDRSAVGWLFFFPPSSRFLHFTCGKTTWLLRVHCRWPLRANAAVDGRTCVLTPTVIARPRAVGSLTSLWLDRPLFNGVVEERKREGGKERPPFDWPVFLSLSLSISRFL